MIEDLDPPVNPPTIPSGGYDDPRGEYPHRKYWNSPSLNKEVTGEEKTSVEVGGGDVGIDAFGEIDDEIPSEYGRIQVQETPGGHKIIMDDTPGGERLILKHRTGAGISMAANGSVNIRSTNNMVISIDANGGIIVEGNLNISSKNLKVDVTGDLDLNITGDWNTTVAGNKNETVYGHHRTSVSGNMSETVSGSKSETVVQSQTNTILGTCTDVVKGDRRNTTGGNLFQSTGGNFKGSAQGEYTVAAPSMNMSAADMTIIGAGGTIGGENIIMYNYNMYAGHTVYAGDTVNTRTLNSTRVNTTSAHGYFVGDLNGCAKQADDPGTFSAGTTAANIADDTRASYKPDADLMGKILKYSSRGINEVSIDAGDYIKNKIDRTTVMGGIANRKLTPEEARMKLKDNINSSNEDFIASLVADGSVSETYFSSKVPPAVGRSYSGSGSVSFAPTGDYDYASSSGANKYITGTRDFLGFSPDPQYNPQDVDPRKGPLSIDGKTLVGNGIPISTFLGSKGGSTNLAHLVTLEERQALARQLLLQAEVLKIAKQNQHQFRRFRAVVAEGVYKKASGETLESESVTALAQTGRAITYELYDANNKSYNEVTYEFAEYLAEYLTGYDKIILSYDTLDPRSSSMQSQVTVIMPEVDQYFKIVGKSKPDFGLKTIYNGKSLSETDLVEVDPYGNVVDEDQLATAQEAAGIVEYQLGGIRNKKVKPALEIILASAARRAKIDKVVITSGLQPGYSGRRTGSTRHDTGLAADLYLISNGSVVTLDTTRGREIISSFVREAVNLGVRGGGMSSGYMGNRVMHLDLLGQDAGAGRYNPDVKVVWKSDSWFSSAFYA
jgi:hypothetical protein